MTSASITAYIYFAAKDRQDMWFLQSNIVRKTSYLILRNFLLQEVFAEDAVAKFILTVSRRNLNNKFHKINYALMTKIDFLKNNDFGLNRGKLKYNDINVNKVYAYVLLHILRSCTIQNFLTRFKLYK